MAVLNPKQRLIVALDHTDAAAALALARELQDVVEIVKVGSILFTACGPELIHAVRALGFEVMLDLKFHDIPSTVELSCRSAVRHQVKLLTVHALGEASMLEAAVKGAHTEAERLGLPRPLIVAVTVLTSVAAAQPQQMQQRVLDLARNALTAQCDGLVSSALEASLLREQFGSQPILVCPGIRPSSHNTHDQRRTCTPAQAIQQGADYLVVGRPITEAQNPRQAAQQMLQEMEARGTAC